MFSFYDGMKVKKNVASQVTGNLFFAKLQIFSEQGEPCFFGASNDQVDLCLT